MSAAGHVVRDRGWASSLARDGLNVLLGHGSVLVFGMRMDLPLAKSALQAGARGFIHVGMGSEQIVRAVEVAVEGAIVAPRALLEFLLFDEKRADPGVLSIRQREILRPYPETSILEKMSWAQAR